MRYAKTGGTFLDCSIHDIDLMWFLSENANIKSLQATPPPGQCSFQALSSSVKAIVVGSGLQKSLVTGENIVFGERS